MQNVLNGATMRVSSVRHDGRAMNGQPIKTEKGDNMNRILKLVAVCATFAVLTAFGGVAEARHCCKAQKVKCCKTHKTKCCGQQTACASNACQTVASTCCSQPAASCGNANVSCCSAPACGSACGAGPAIQTEVKEVPAPPKEEPAPAPKA